MAEDFFKKIGNDWKKGFEKFKENVDKTFKLPPKKSSTEKQLLSDQSSENIKEKPKNERSIIEKKTSPLDQWTDNWKSFTNSAQQTLTKWQEDWESQAKKIEENNRKNRLAFKAKTDEFNQNVKNFFENQQTAFNNKIQEMEAKYKQRNMEQKEAVEEMAAEWNAFIDDSKSTFKQLQKSQDRIFWKTTGYWLVIILILMGVVFGILWLLRFLNILPSTTPVTTI